jgi:YcaO-like protein with predicted kinase domain
MAPPITICGRDYAMPKGHTLGTHRTRSPAETFSEYARFMPAMGITRLANLTGLDHIGLPVYTAIRPTARSLTTAQGKGLTAEAAKVSALMESIEAWHAEQIELPLRWESYLAQRETAPVVDVTGLPLMEGRILPHDRPWFWVEGYDLVQQHAVWVPFDAVTLNLVFPPDFQPIFLPSSNGLASGNHLLEAIVHGLCEVIERDAATLWRLTDDWRPLDLATVDDTACIQVLDLLARAGVHVAAWDLTADSGVPAYGCVIMEHPDQLHARGLGVYDGYGCHLSPGVALLRALTEAVQCRCSYIAGSRDDIFYREYQRLTDDSMLRGAWNEITTTTALQPFDSRPSLATDSFEEDLAILLSALRCSGITSVVVVNLTKPAIEIPVVKVLVPGLKGLSDVNIRAGLQHAEARGLIAAATHQALCRAAKAMFYPERSWPSVLEAGRALGLPADELEALKRFVRHAAPDVKRADAIALLRRIAQARASEAVSSQARLTFEPTYFWLQMAEEIEMRLQAPSETLAGHAPSESQGDQAAGTMHQPTPDAGAEQGADAWSQLSADPILSRTLHEASVVLEDLQHWYHARAGQDGPAPARPELLAELVAHYLSETQAGQGSDNGGELDRRHVQQLWGLADRYREQGQYDTAEHILQRALAITEQAFGPEDYDIAGLLNGLGVTHRYQGRYDEAETCYQHALPLLERILGPSHPDVATLYHNLGGIEHARGRYAHGEPFARLSVSIRERALGADYPAVAADKAALAALLDGQGYYAEAEPLYQQAITVYQCVFGPDYRELAVIYNNLAAIAQARSDSATAERLYREALGIKEHSLGPAHPDVGVTLNNLAVLYKAQGRYAEAEPLYQRALVIFEAALGSQHPNVIACRQNYRLLVHELHRHSDVGRQPVHPL